jgi:5,5'-dehydrodivanillate O-demethylase
MLTPDKNLLLTSTGAGTPMGELLRRHWMPIAGVSEFQSLATKPVRLLGEDLVLYRDLSGNYGLVDRHCPHRRADMSHGMVEREGLRCSYHGWRFGADGACLERPFEEVQAGAQRPPSRVRTKAYPVRAMAGLLWAYLGPQPAPLLPNWEPFTRPNGFVQIVLTEVPCNWFQCQENSIDPVHFEWLHENWGSRKRDGETARYGPTHLKLDFEEFEFGFVYKRVRDGGSEKDPLWTVGRVCLWPNAFYLGDHFEWRVPVDDRRTLSVMWRYTRVPRDREPYVQGSIPTWHGPLTDAQGRFIDSHVMNQDFLSWVGQGEIADRTQEHLGASDRGIVMLRRRFFEELEHLARGGEPKGVVRDPARNQGILLPTVDLERARAGYSREEILADPMRLMRYTTYIFQAGQPEAVRREFAAVMGFEPREYTGLR